MPTARIVIVGAGQAGVQAADSLRSAGHRGPITLLSSERATPYQRPQLSKESLLTETTEAEYLPLRPASFYRDYDIDLRLGVCAERLDTRRQTLLLSDGSVLAYDHLIVATGTRARRLSMPGSEAPGVHTIRVVEDAERLRPALRPGAHAVLIGAGFIALEVAAAARRRGMAVTVLTGARSPMGRAISPVTSEWFRAHHDGDGVVFSGDEAAAIATDDTGSARAVITAGGAEIAADVVVMGVGAVPNTEFLAGTKLIDTRGVLVSPTLRTADPRIWALGDCACVLDATTGTGARIESVQNATDQARLVAANLMAAESGQPLTSYGAVPWFWSHQGSARLQIVGRHNPQHTDTVIVGDLAENKFSVLRFDAAGQVRAVESVNRPADHMAARKILSAGIPLSRAVAAGEGFSLKTHAKAAAALSG